MLGKRDALELLLLGLLADGHVLIEDYPGLAKTLMARSFAAGGLDGLLAHPVHARPDALRRHGLVGLQPARGRLRVPAGPDLRQPAARRRDQPRPAEDAGGAARGDAGAPGDVRRATTRPLGPPFLVLATQNPIEYEGTYPLPEAQLDRFLLRMSVGYPARDDEWQMLPDPGRARARRGRRSSRSSTAQTLLELQAAVRDACTSPSRSASTWSISSPRPARRQSIQVGASPRGSLALLKLSRCRAALAGRDYVTPDDVKAIAVPALAHRLTLRPGAVGAADLGRGRRARAARRGADAGRPRISRRPGDAATATPKLTALRRALGARAADGARLRAAPSSSPSPRRSCSRSGSGLALAAPPRLTVVGWSSPSRARARRRARSTRSRLVESETRRRPARPLRAAPRRAERRRRAPTRSRCSFAAARERRELDAQPPTSSASAATCSARPSSRARDPLGFLVWEQTVPTTARAARLPARARRCSVSLQPARDAGVLAATRSRARRATGSSSPTSGRGRRGDALKRVNWRASARRGELWVNESHPERNTDVILFVDSFAEARIGGEGTLDLAVRATAVARRRLRRGAATASA